MGGSAINLPFIITIVGKDGRRNGQNNISSRGHFAFVSDNINIYIYMCVSDGGRGS